MGGYDLPAWMTAVWEDVKMIAAAVQDTAEMVVGAASLVVDDALIGAEVALGHAVAQCSAAFTDMQDAAADGARAVEAWTADVGAGAVSAVHDVAAEAEQIAADIAQGAEEAARRVGQK